MSAREAGPSAPAPFGALLRRHRIAAGLTQEELAERAGISVRRVGDLERGVQQIPRRDTVALLAAPLGLSGQEQAAFTEAARRIETPIPALPVASGAATPPFVGRTSELALLERHLAGQGPPLLLFAGEPGIGKTRLLHAAIPRAVAHGLQVLEGGCQRRGGHDPYAPLLGALQRYLRGRQPAQVRADLRGCAWLVRLLPELAAGPIEPRPQWTLSPEQERRLMVEAVIRFLGNVVGPAGTLLVLDDLQWASLDALDLLVTLVRSAGDIPLRLIGAYRDTEVQPHDPLSETLADLAHARLATRRHLAPLGKEEAAHLLDELLEGRAELDGAPRDGILQRAGGVPFFLVSFAQGLRPRDVASQGAGSDRVPEAVPWDVAQSVRQRVAALPAGAGEVLGVAAMLGRTVQTALLTMVVEQGEGVVLAALHAAGQARLLEDTDEQGMQFAHDVIREVVETDLGAARRRVLHRRIAETLERQPGDRPVELLAYHYSRSEEQTRALLYLEQAGDWAAAHYAHAAARDYYQQAISRLGPLRRPAEVARICEKLGVVLKTMGRYDQALQMLERAAAIHCAAGDLEAEGRVMAAIGKVHFEAGTWEEGIARVRRLLAPLEAREPSPALAALYLALIPLFAPTGRYRDYLATAERASALARSLGDRWLLAESETWRGVALAEMDRQSEARPVLEGALSLAEVANHLQSRGWALAFLGQMYLADGALAQACRAREQALEAFEELGDRGDSAWGMCLLADIHVLTGTWTKARTLYEQAAALLHDLGGATRFSSAPLVGLGILSLHEGSYEEACRYLEEGAAMAARVRHLGSLRAAKQALAEHDLLDGRPQAAFTRLQQLLKDLDLEDSGLTKPMPVLAQAQLALGKLADAEGMVSAGLMRARERCTHVDLVQWLRLRAMVSIRQEQWQEAQRALDEAIALTRGMPYPYAEARLLHVYGQMHVQKQEPALARERLEAALAIFRRLGALRDAERVEQELREIEPLAPIHPIHAAGA
jgi:tetratricopeptide (TPR) repeat protein/transcriptional regulator with XRE-family HTH domain